MAEQLWTLNAVWRDKYDYPHYVDMISPKSKEDQRASDEREKEQVYAWLMGGETE